MAGKKMCPTHPRHPVDNCPPCETKIAAAEDRASGLWDPPDAWQRGQDEYERWLDRIGEGG